MIGVPVVSRVVAEIVQDWEPVPILHRPTVDWTAKGQARRLGTAMLIPVQVKWSFSFQSVAGDFWKVLLRHLTSANPKFYENAKNNMVGYIQFPNRSVKLFPR